MNQMTRTAFLTGLLAAAVATGGCTHLETRPTGEVASVGHGAATGQGAQLGVSYALPMLQYSVEVTYRLSACPTATTDLAFIWEVKTSNNYVAGERFEVDYRALSSVMKTTNFELNLHPSGTLESINASAQDRTGPMLGDIARIGVSIASIAAGAPVLPANFGQQLEARGLGRLDALMMTERRIAEQPPRLVCEAKVAEALGNRQGVLDAIKERTAEVAQRTNVVEQRAVLALSEVGSDGDRELYRTAVNDLLTAQNALAERQIELAKIDEKITVKQTFVWPEQVSETEAVMSLNDANLRKLAKLFKIDTGGVAVDVLPTDEIPCSSVTLRLGECLRRAANLNGALRLAATQARVPAGTQQRDWFVRPNSSRWARGIFVREPTQVRLRICKSHLQSGPAACAAPNVPHDQIVYNDVVVMAPQFGRLRLLPFTNGPFEEGEIELALREDGSIETFRYGEASSAANAAAGLREAAERVDAGLERLEEERRSDIRWQRDERTYARTEAAAVRTEAAANRADEIAQLVHQIDLIRRQKELLLAQAGADTTEIEAITLQLNAQLAQAQARLALLRASAELAMQPGS